MSQRLCRICNEPFSPGPPNKLMHGRKEKPSCYQEYYRRAMRMKRSDAKGIIPADGRPYRLCVCCGRGHHCAVDPDLLAAASWSPADLSTESDP